MSRLTAGVSANGGKSRRSDGFREGLNPSYALTKPISAMSPKAKTSFHCVAIKATEACAALAAGVGVPAGLFCAPRNRD
jgi:hypothetical protein